MFLMKQDKISAIQKIVSVVNQLYDFRLLSAISLQILERKSLVGLVLLRWRQMKLQIDVSSI